MSSLDSFFENVKLPSMSEVAQALIKSLHDADTSIGELSELIARDPAISAKLLRELGGDAVIGPMLVGMEKSVQIAPMTSTASELVTLAVLAAGGIAR